MLGIKKVGSNGVGDEEWNGKSQQQRQPAKEMKNRHRENEVQYEGDQAIVVFSRFVEEGIKTHSMKKHENIPEQDGQRMTHEQVIEAFRLR